MPKLLYPKCWPLPLSARIVPNPEAQDATDACNETVSIVDRMKLYCVTLLSRFIVSRGAETCLKKAANIIFTNSSRHDIEFYLRSAYSYSYSNYVLSSN